VSADRTGMSLLAKSKISFWWSMTTLACSGSKATAAGTRLRPVSCFPSAEAFSKPRTISKRWLASSSTNQPETASSGIRRLRHPSQSCRQWQCRSSHERGTTTPPFATLRWNLVASPILKKPFSAKGRGIEPVEESIGGVLHRPRRHEFSSCVTS